MKTYAAVLVAAFVIIGAAAYVVAAVWNSAQLAR